jgi:hypothetical protein
MLPLPAADAKNLAVVAAGRHPDSERKCLSRRHFPTTAGAGTRLDTPDGMSDRGLLRHLGWVVALKLAVLVALWWTFVRDARVGVDDGVAAARLATPVGSVTAPQGVRP